MNVKFNEKKRLLECAEHFCLTKETVHNLLKQVLDDLEEEEKYEECVRIKTKTGEYLNKLRQLEIDSVRNVGLSNEQKKYLFSL